MTRFLFWVSFLGMVSLSLALVPGCGDQGGSLAGDDDDCVVPGDDDDDDDDSAPNGEMSLSGEVSRVIPPVLDGVGTLVVRLFSVPPPGGELAAEFILEDADLSRESYRVAYSFSGLVPQAGPFAVIAFLDDDESGGRADENDMRLRPRAEVEMQAAGDYNLDIELNAYGISPGGGDDDDSSGDDDDSTGDDDDSTGDDDDSTGDDDDSTGDDDDSTGDDDDSTGDDDDSSGDDDDSAADGGFSR